MQLAQTSKQPAWGEYRAVVVHAPARQTVPFVYASPHSGRAYPEPFLQQARLDPMALRRSEDCFVDELFAGAPRVGAPLVAALFPRAYCDANREPYELDPAMFVDDLPKYANTTSMRVAGGLGTIARVVGAGNEIYRGKLTFADAENRIETCYRPYHLALKETLLATEECFGHAILIDCHSMPSIGGLGDNDPGAVRPDIILGDRFGSSCDAIVTEMAEKTFAGLGYRVARNAPYAGGFTTQHYGRPEQARHALQIEINRALYMDERRLTKLARFADVAADMHAFMQTMATLLTGVPAPACR